MVVTAVQTLVAAGYLEPEGFGTFAIVSVAAMMASICGPGFIAAAYREVPHYQSIGDEEKVRIIINHVACGELVIAAAWSFAIAIFALAQGDAQSLPLLMIVAVSVIPSKLVSVYQLLAYRVKDFDLQSRVDMARAIITALLVIAFIWNLGIVIVLLAPIVANAVGAGLYARKYPLSPAPTQLLMVEFSRLAGIGLPLTGVNIVNSMSGLQRWAERVLIQVFVGTSALGVYALFSWVALSLMTLTGSVIQALQPHLYDVMSRTLSEKEIETYLLRPMRALTVGGALLFGVCSVVLPDLVAAFLSPYAEGVLVMQCLLFAAYLNCVYWVPAIMIFSVRFDGLIYYFWACTIGVLISIISATALLYAGTGALAVAIGFALSQTVVGTLTVARLWRYLFPASSMASRFFSSLLGPLLNVVAAIIAVHFLSSLLNLPSEPIVFYLFAACGKGVAFLAICIPAIVMLERTTGIYREHIQPFLLRLRI